MKGQYAALEHFLQKISKELKVEPLNALECVKKLLKAQDMADLQARVDCLLKEQDMADLRAQVDYLLKENGELKSQVATGEAQLKEVGALKAAVEEELVRTREDRNKAIAISWKFHNFIEHPSDVVNKARLYDKSIGQPGASLGSKII